MGYSINGFGTTYYGRRDFERDGSFVTTKWVIAATLPIAPLGSLRIREGRRGLGSQQMFVVDEPGMDWLQVLMTYVYVYLLVPTALYMTIMHEQTFIERFHVPFGVVMLERTGPLLLVIALPFMLRWFARRGAPQRVRVRQ